MDLVSIIVPVYNSEKYLERCIKSILNQSYKNLEIILVNDESTDSSAEICNNYARKDERIKVIHIKNSGPSVARNIAINACRGNYITFIDADDWVSDDYLEILYKKICETNADISMIKTSLVIENNSVIKDVTPPKRIIEAGYTIFEKDDIIKELLTQKVLDNYISGKLYKSDLIKNTKFVENVVFENYIYIYDILDNITRMVYIEKECYYHLKHGASISATCSEKNILDYIDAILYRYERIKDEYNEFELYNHIWLLKEITNACVKYVIANSYYENVEEKLVYIFDILTKFSLYNENEFIKLLDDFQKTSIFLIRYNCRLFFDLLAARHNLKWKRKFDSKNIGKPKIALICDVPNWAFDNISQIVKKGLEHKYNIRIDYFNRRTEANFFYELIERNDDCDLIHFLNRRMLLLIESESFKNKVEAHGKNLEEYISKNKEKFSTAVYDFIDLDDKGIEEHKPIFNEYTKKYYTSTQKLFDIYSSIDGGKKPDAMIHDICDKEIYIPINLKRFEFEEIKNRPIVIGWVGNSHHSGENVVDLKGFNTILKPVVNELIEEGYNLIGYYADRNERWRATEEMPNYYSKIDICVCTSIHEGTPRPVLESMYCGIPIISTDVGIVNEALGEKQKEFIIGDRRNGQNDKEIKEKLKEKIIYLYNNRHLFKELSEENMVSIEKFDGGKIIKEFEKYFDECLKVK